MKREMTSRGIQVLLAFLDDHLLLARALRERRYADLHAAARVASLPVSRTMALTHPAKYRAIRDAVTLFDVKGYGAMNVDLLEELAEEQEARLSKGTKEW